jgi:hypothetical protein
VLFLPAPNSMNNTQQQYITKPETGLSSKFSRGITSDPPSQADLPFPRLH